MVAGIRRLVLDVMKPQELSLVELANAMSDLEGIEGVNINLIEIDKDTENIKVTIVGSGLDYEEITKLLESHGSVIHSIDEVVSGKKVVESVETLQD